MLQEFDSHLLVKIFRNTSPKDRLNLMLVSKRFKELISNVEILMEGICVVYNPEWNPDFQKTFDDFLNCMIQSTRSYQSFKIHVKFNFSFTNFLPLHKFQSVTELDLFGGDVDENNPEVFAQLISGFQNLEVLDSAYRFPECEVKLKTRNLKKLKFEYEIPSFEVVPDFECLSLCSWHPSADTKAAAILSNLQNLKKLKLDGATGHVITENFVPTCNFKLKEFFIFIDEDCARAIPGFIRSQNELENLNLVIAFFAGSSIINETLKLQNLEFLSIDFCEGYFFEYELDDDAPINQSVKRFKVEGIIDENSTFLPKMLQRMPNLKELYFDDGTYYRYPLNSLKMLEKLGVCVTSKDSILAELQLPNLQEANFKNIGLDDEEDFMEKIPFFDTEEFLKFLENHPNLKTLEIHDALMKEQVWKYIKENMRLEILKIVVSSNVYQEMHFLLTDSEYKVQTDSDYLVKILVQRVK